MQNSPVKNVQESPVAESKNTDDPIKVNKKKRAVRLNEIKEEERSPTRILIPEIKSGQGNEYGIPSF